MISHFSITSYTPTDCLPLSEFRGRFQFLSHVTSIPPPPPPSPPALYILLVFFSRTSHMCMYRSLSLFLPPTPPSPLIDNCRMMTDSPRLWGEVGGEDFRRMEPPRDLANLPRRDQTSPAPPRGPAIFVRFIELFQAHARRRYPLSTTTTTINSAVRSK